MKTVFVTGSEGYLGSLASETLKTRGHAVIPFDLKLGDDLGDLDSVIEASQGATTAVHLAAIPHPTILPFSSYYEANIRNAYHLAEACKVNQIDRLVHISTAGIYATQPRNFDITDENTPTLFNRGRENVMPEREFYSWSKLAAEAIVGAYGRGLQVDVMVLRFCPAGSASTAQDLCDRFVAYTTSELAATAIYSAVEYPEYVGYETFNIGEGEIDCSKAKGLFMHDWR